MHFGAPRLGKPFSNKHLRFAFKADLSVKEKALGRFDAPDTKLRRFRASDSQALCQSIDTIDIRGNSQQVRGGVLLAIRS